MVPNLYPAFERQEVVVHSPRHVRSLAELEPRELELVAESWRRRAAANRSGYLFALVNEGRDAGSSLAHSHSQLTWLPAPPPAVVAEPTLPAGKTVLERDGLTLTCPCASRLPYEFQLAPTAAEGDAFTSPLLMPALLLLAEAVRALRRLEGPVPLNVWLHNGAHWHLEVLPRITILAGLELGAGVFVNALPPEEAAGRLSGALENGERRLTDDPPDDSAATAGV